MPTRDDIIYGFVVVKKCCTVTHLRLPIVVAVVVSTCLNVQCIYYYDCVDFVIVAD